MDNGESLEQVLARWLNHQADKVHGPGRSNYTLARALGVSEAQVRMWRSGQRPIAPKYIPNIAEALETTQAELRERVGLPPAPDEPIYVRAGRNAGPPSTSNQRRRLEQLPRAAQRRLQSLSEARERLDSGESLSPDEWDAIKREVEEFALETLPERIALLGREGMLRLSDHVDRLLDRQRALDLRRRQEVLFPELADDDVGPDLLDDLRAAAHRPPGQVRDHERDAPPDQGA